MMTWVYMYRAFIAPLSFFLRIYKWWQEKRGDLTIKVERLWGLKFLPSDISRLPDELRLQFEKRHPPEEVIYITLMNHGMKPIKVTKFGGMKNKETCFLLNCPYIPSFPIVIPSQDQIGFHVPIETLEKWDYYKVWGTLERTWKVSGKTMRKLRKKVMHPPSITMK